MGAVLAVGAAVGMAVLESAAQNDLGTSPDCVDMVTAGTVITNTSTTSATLTNAGTYQGWAYLVVNATNITGTSPKLTVTLQDSSDYSTWTSQSVVASLSTNFGYNDFGATAVVPFWINGMNKYMRTTNAISGSTASYNYSVTIIAPKKYR